MKTWVGGCCQHRTAVCLLPEGGGIQATVCQLIVLEVQLPESRLEAQGSSGHLGDKIVLEEGESEVEHLAGQLWQPQEALERRCPGTCLVCTRQPSFVSC